MMSILVKNCSAITEKGDIVAEKDVLVASTKSRNLSRLHSPHKVIVLCNGSRVLYMIVEVLKEVNICSCINKRTLPRKRVGRRRYRCQLYVCAISVRCGTT